MSVEISETRTYNVYVHATGDLDAEQQAKDIVGHGLIKHTVVDIQCFPEVYDANVPH